VWSIQGQSGPDQQTPDLSSVVQEVVNRPGWSAGNPLSIMITGTGERVAHSFDTNAGAPATLHLSYVEVGQSRPVVDAGPDQLVAIDEVAVLDGTVSDDGLPGGGLTTQWSVISGPGSVTFADAAAVDTTATFSAVGSYALRLTADDGQLSAADELMVQVTSANGQIVLEVQVANGFDDAEESATGDVAATSSDLEMVEEATTQTVGVRFNGVTVPAGAQIIQAWIQFTADEVDAVPTSLAIRAQATDDAPIIQQVLNDLSSRTLTSASTGWDPPAWNTQGESAAAQRTADLATVVQEVVDRPGWADGNSVLFVVTGSGKRVAESYNGAPASAAVLHLEYTLP
jgi:hypothetical protein